MYILYKNVNDNLNVHLGELLTPINKLETSIYCDCAPMGDIINRKPDWKNSHISDIGMEYVLCISDTTEKLVEHYKNEILKNKEA